MKWFENWFDSEYYHILYKDRNQKEAELFINKLIKKLNLKKNSKLIDIGCGKGRHATYFNKKGMNVVGIDLSKNSIQSAKKNENQKLQFIVHDMRKIFKKNEFNIVTNLFTSFGYFKNYKDEQNSINAMASNLKKNGILIIDFMNVKKVISNLVKYEEKTINGIHFKIERKILNNYIYKKIVFEDNNQNYIFEEQVKALTLIDFSKLIKKAGMSIINIFGSYNLDDFNAINSDRLIIISKKRNYISQ